VSSETARLRKEQAITDKHLAKSTAALDKKRPQHIALKQELAHLAKSLVKEKERLEEAVADAKKQASATKKLERDLAKVQEQLDQLQAALEAEDEKSKELKLAAEQLTEYNELKQKAAIETAELTARIKSAQHEHRAVAEAADSVRMLMAGIEERIATMHQTQEELEARRAKNADIVDSAKQQLTQYKKELAAMREKTEKAKSVQWRTRMRAQLIWLTPSASSFMRSLIISPFSDLYLCMVTILGSASRRWSLSSAA